MLERPTHIERPSPRHVLDDARQGGHPLTPLRAGLIVLLHRLHKVAGQLELGHTGILPTPTLARPAKLNVLQCTTWPSLL